MNAAELADSVAQYDTPADGLSPEAQALWHAKKGNWDESHDIIQEIHTSTASWIHALLHLIEGDVGNANYWFHKARRPTRRVEEIDALWNEMAIEVLGA